MKKILQSGRYLFGIAIIGFGIINLITGNFPLAFMPPIASSLIRVVAVYGIGIILVATGICIIVNKFPKTAATIIAMLFLLDFIYPQLTQLFSNFKNPNQWTVTLEILALCSGAFILAASLKDDFQKPIISNNTISKISQVARYTFAISLLGFGILHYMYADFIATLIPAWMPAHLFLDYIVLFGFFAAGLSIIINIQSRLATFLLGIMFLIWVVTLHLPRSIASPSIVAEWSSLFIALAMSAVSFIIANAIFWKEKDL